MNKIKKVFWSEQYMMFIGEKLTTENHAHQGIQLSMALEGEMTVRCQLEDHVGQMIFIASNEPHQVKCDEDTIMLLIEQESVLGEKLSYMLKGSVVILNNDDIQVVARSLMKGTSLEDADRLYHMIEAWIDMENYKVMDPRILDVVQYIKSHLDSDLTAMKLAEKCCLSESRFQHVFKSTMGVSLSKYLLWVRVKHAITWIHEGHRFTDAALAAGFSDGSHFSRTLKHTFGVVLRDFLKDSSSIQVILE